MDQIRVKTGRSQYELSDLDSDWPILRNDHWCNGTTGTGYLCLEPTCVHHHPSCTLNDLTDEVTIRFIYKVCNKRYHPIGHDVIASVEGEAKQIVIAEGRRSSKGPCSLLAFNIG
ncbi:hypothetical protein MUK42_33840 [Musa troglodytarum]|uniref:BIRD-IDD transcription factor second C2H2 zinc finger domain-containing protein n=1 Tax=Musa troglodytarum TaxID=320322 RepID=A0A9E7EBH5_9LILI|nr:hypothetical protein MUK42_33840 [Musa troglodytarum]